MIQLAQQHLIDRTRIVREAAVVRAAWPTGDWPERERVVPVLAPSAADWHQGREALERQRARQAARHAAQEAVAAAWRASREGQRVVARRRLARRDAMARVRACRRSPKQEAAALRARVRQAREWRLGR